MYHTFNIVILSRKNAHIFNLITVVIDNTSKYLNL